MNKILFQFTSGLFLTAACLGLAQTIPSSGSAPVDATTVKSSVGTKADFAQFGTNLKWREDLAKAIIKGEGKSTDAVARLKSRGSASGFKIEPDADIAYAAADVGRRLVAAGKYAEAGEFFREAEQALGRLIKKTPDEAAFLKAALLSERATLRVNYLGEADGAKTDFDAALALQPKDPRLKQQRDDLGSGKGKVFGQKPSSDSKTPKSDGNP